MVINSLSHVAHLVRQLTQSNEFWSNYALNMLLTIKTPIFSGSSEISSPKAVVLCIYSIHPGISILWGALIHPDGVRKQAESVQQIFREVRAYNTSVISAPPLSEKKITRKESRMWKHTERKRSLGEHPVARWATGCYPTDRIEVMAEASVILP